MPHEILSLISQYDFSIGGELNLKLDNPDIKNKHNHQTFISQLSNGNIITKTQLIYDNNMKDINIWDQNTGQLLHTFIINKYKLLDLKV